jgi:hypothetical protein
VPVSHHLGLFSLLPVLRLLVYLPNQLFALLAWFFRLRLVQLVAGFLLLGLNLAPILQLLILLLFACFGLSESFVVRC